MSSTAAPSPSPSQIIGPGAQYERKCERNVTVDDREKYDRAFKGYTGSSDGRIQGDVASRAMSLSGLPGVVLEQILTMSDIDHKGKLDMNQFGVAMHLIQRQIQGKSLLDGRSLDLVRMYNGLVK